MFKVGDKVKIKPYNELDLDKNLYVGWEYEVSCISGGEFCIRYVNSAGQIALDTISLLGVEFTVYPEDVIPVTTSTKNPRPHAELIKQWADDDSLEIEVSIGRDWHVTKNPEWHEWQQYRIKPKTVTKWRWAYEVSTVFSTISVDHYTEEEFHRQYKDAKNSSKLLWTEKEFQVV